MIYDWPTRLQSLSTIDDMKMQMNPLLKINLKQLQAKQPVSHLLAVKIKVLLFYKEATKIEDFAQFVLVL